MEKFYKISFWVCMIALVVGILSNLIIMPIDFRSEIIPKIEEYKERIDVLEVRADYLEEQKAAFEEKLRYQGKHTHKFFGFIIK